ncbi:choice-of-anchor D domain-containing protein [Bacteroidota bacterium]
MYNENGERINNLNLDNFDVTENGIKKEIIGEINCPDEINDTISSVLCIDVSGSMNEQIGNMSKLKIAKNTAISWVENIDLNQSECGLVSFSKFSTSECALTHIEGTLIDKINNLKTKNTTNYEFGFKRSIDIVSHGKFKKIIVFLTDGDPNEGDYKLSGADEIIQLALAASIRIYCVTIDDKITKGFEYLNKVSKETGGILIPGINYEENPDSVFIEIFRMIREYAQGNYPCKITWESDVPCDSVKDVQFEINISNLGLHAKSSYSYVVPPEKMPKLYISRNSFYFESNQPNESISEIMTISAGGTPVQVTDINIEKRPLSSDGIFNISDTSFSLGSNESRTLTITFKSGSSNKDSIKYLFGLFTFITESGCPAPKFYASGLARIMPDSPTLKLVYPNGGELLSPCIDTNIVWEGILPEEKVILEFSTNEGISWDTISRSASGLKYKWNIPCITENNCLVRVSHIRDSVLTLKHNGKVNVVNFSTGDNYVITGYDNGAIIWETLTGRPIDTLITNSNIVAAGYTKDGYIYTAGSEGIISIFDLENKKINEITTNHIINSANTSPLPSSDNNNTLIAASFEDDKTVKAWDIKTGELEFSFVPHDPEEGILFTSFSPQDDINAPEKMLTLNQGDRNVKLWMNDNGEIKNLKGAFSGGWDNITQTANYSNDGSKIFSGHGNGTIRVWDTSKTSEDSKKIEGFHSPINYIGHSTNKMYNDLGIFASQNNTVGLFNYKVSIFIKYLHEHNQSVNFTTFANSLAMAASASDDSTAKIWDLSKNILQSDISDNIFAIEKPNIELKDADFGKVTNNTVKSIVFNKLICNNGNLPLTITTIKIGGNNPDEFLIGGIDSGRVILPSECISPEISFFPKETGTRQAEIEIILGNGGDCCLFRINLSGESGEPIIKYETEIDFDTVVVNLEIPCQKVFNLKIQNIGDAPAIIREPLIINNEEVFFFLEPTDPSNTFQLTPQEEKIYEIVFQPELVGPQGSSIKFECITNNSIDYINILGYGIPSKALIEIPDTINFGTRHCRDLPADTSFIIKNTAGDHPCDTNLIIYNIVLVSQYYDSLRQDNDSIIYPITIPTQDSFMIKFSLVDEAIGFKDAILKIYSNAANASDSLSEIYLLADIECETEITIKAPHTSGKNGDIVNIPITLHEIKNIPEREISINTDLEYNATMLVPWDDSPDCDSISNDYWCTIPLTNLVVDSHSQVGDILINLRFLVSLGNDKETPLRLLNSRSSPDDELVIVKDIDGSFTTTDICIEDDSSRFFVIGPVPLQQNKPNPFSQKTEIQYIIEESGYSRLFVIDLLGRTKEIIIEGEINPGKYTAIINGMKYRPGLYLYILQTPTRTFTKKMEVVR